MIYPLLWLLMSSFKSNDTMFHNAFSLIPEKWDIIQNYASGFKGIAGISFWTFFKNSAIVTVASVAGSIFCSLLAAYAVSRVEFKGANFWFGCIVMTMMIPSQVMVVPQYIILKKVGLSDTLVSMTLPWIFGYAFFIFLIVQYMRGIPRDLDEAAMLDGCSKIGVLFKITAFHRHGVHLRVLLDLAGLLPAADLRLEPEELHDSSGAETVHRSQQLQQLRRPVRDVGHLAAACYSYLYQVPEISGRGYCHRRH